MLKKVLIILVIFIFLSGCKSVKYSNVEVDLMENYLGPSLNVGVVGSQQELPVIENVKYESTELKNVKGNSEEFDILVITSEGFEEADKEKYIALFNTIEYPVLFFGMKDFQMFAFTTEGMTIETSKDDNVGYISGFENRNGEKVGISVFKSETQPESDQELLNLALNKLYEVES